MYNYDHDCPFEAYITNLGKYNEGELKGEWVKFPTTYENIQEVFKRIGIGSEYENGSLPITIAMLRGFIMFSVNMKVWMNLIILPIALRTWTATIL